MTNLSPPNNINNHVRERTKKNTAFVFLLLAANMVSLERGDRNLVKILIILLVLLAFIFVSIVSIYIVSIYIC